MMSASTVEAHVPHIDTPIQGRAVLKKRVAEGHYPFVVRVHHENWDDTAWVIADVAVWHAKKYEIAVAIANGNGRWSITELY